nr:hypothetical protein OH820_06710 [Streptomyces sp. NBC_00857]
MTLVVQTVPIESGERMTRQEQASCRRPLSAPPASPYVPSDVVGIVGDRSGDCHVYAR